MTTTLSIPSPAMHTEVATRHGWSAPRVLLQLEAAAICVAAVIAYRHLGASGRLFAALILIPDLSMLGYLVSTRVGAITYNAVHNYLAPAVLAGFGLLLGSHLALVLATIWLAHVGADRAMGYGLKYATAFRATHLGRV